MPNRLKCFVLAYTDQILAPDPRCEKYYTRVLATVYAKDKSAADEKLRKFYGAHYKKTGCHLWTIDHTDFKPYLHEVPIVLVNKPKSKPRVSRGITY